METARLLPLAPYPPRHVQSTLPPAEWQACLEAWILGVELRLRLSSKEFRGSAGPLDATAFTFLESYLAQTALSQWPKHVSTLGHNAFTLRRLCFVLARRFVLENPSHEGSSPNDSFHFFSDLCQTYYGSALLKDICSAAWQNDRFNMENGIRKAKAAAVLCLYPGKDFDTAKQADLLRRLNVLTSYIPEVGLTLMTGSDFLDSLDVAYRYNQELVSSETEVPRQLVATLYRSLKALTGTNPTQGSLFMDQLFSLKASHSEYIREHPKSSTILSDLLCTTPFLMHLQDFLATSSQKRGDSLLEYLRSVQATEMYLFPQNLRQNPKRRSKGKARATTEADHDIHVHSLTLASQVQELFPDLSTEYILRLLSHFQDDVESVTAALLEPESLPSSLQERILEEHKAIEQNQSAPLPAGPMLSNFGERRNVFDNDDFSNLRISSSQLHFGKKDQVSSQQISTSERLAQKAAILSALAKFDSDSDERDDTYDVADVGGTVDASIPGTDDAEARPMQKEQQDRIEEVLYRAWKSNRDLFARDTRTRLSQPRTGLKQETGWTDEQVEGWAIVLERDSRRQNNLERKYGMGATRNEGASQMHIERTAWRASDLSADDGTEADGDVPGPSNPFRGSGRGRGRGSRGRAEVNTAGPANEHATQVARRRKEQGKGGRGGGNHGRREGRAKKMARGFGGIAS